MLALISVLFFSCIATFCYADSQTYLLKSGDYELSISPRYKQTMRSLAFEGRMLATPKGFYNLVIGEKAGKYVGAGHTEGGEEEVITFSLFCDGKEITPEIGQVYQGEEIILEKKSKLLQTIFFSRIIISPEGIIEQKRFQTLAEQDLYYLYLYMYCFDKNCTDFAAMDSDGKLHSGKFDGNFEAKSYWHLNSDVKWAAILDSNSEHAFLLYYPQIIKGSSRKSAFWEVKEAYNKYYTMAETQSLPAGYSSPIYSIILKGFRSDAKDLPLVAKQLAEKSETVTVPDLAMPPISMPALETTGENLPSILFSADYTLSDDSFTAQQAAGNPEPKFLLQDKAKVNFDLMAHSNRGLQIGENCASLQYSSKDNLPLNGTLEMTFSNAWKGDLNEIVVLAQSGPGKNLPGQGKFYIYKYKNSGIAAYFEIGPDNNNVFLNASTADWDVDSWHHLTVSFSDGTVKLYLDGTLRKTALLGQAPKLWPDTFVVGPFSKNLGYISNSTIANFNIYNKILSANEISSLAIKRLPSLKKQLEETEKAKAHDDVVLASSPWFVKKEKLFLEALADDYVPHPWSDYPLEVENDTLSAWGRRYDFTSSALLQDIETDSGSLFKKPLSLLLNDQNIAFNAPEYLTKKAGRVHMLRHAQYQEVHIELHSILEYDGMLWNTLKVVSGVQNIEKLDLIMPVHAQFSEFLHYVGAPKVYESQDLVHNSFSKELSKDTGLIFESSLRTNLWMGNNRAGILYFLESDQYFYPYDRNNLFTIKRLEDGSTEFKVAMISTKLPENCPKQIQFQFGLMGTPVKPLPKGWRGYTYTAQYDSFKGDARGSHLIYWPDQWRSMMLDPEPTRAQNLQKNRFVVQNDLAEKRQIIPYWTRLHFITRDGEKVNPDAWILEKSWAALPGRPGGGSRQYERASTSSSWTDYLVWCTEEWGKIFGHLDGVYMDETQPIPNFNSLSGGGYDDFDSVRRPTFEALASRDLIKRINYGIERKTGKQASSVAHCSATHTMQNIGHYQGMLIGEHLYSGYFLNRNPEFLPPESDRLYYYSYALPLDRLRAECYHRQWGAVMIWLPCLKDQRDIMEHPIPTRDLLSRVMQADMLVWPLFCNAEEVRKTWKFRKEFEITNPEVSFVPYWENKLYTCPVSDIAIGYYQQNEQYLVLISNFSRKTQDVTLHYPAKVNIKSCQNAEDETEIKNGNGKIQLTIPRNDYRALRINY